MPFVPLSSLLPSNNSVEGRLIPFPGLPDSYERLTWKRSEVKNKLFHRHVHWKCPLLSFLPSCNRLNQEHGNTLLLSCTHPTFYVNILLTYFVGSSIYFLIQHTHTERLLHVTHWARGTGEEQGNSGRRWHLMLVSLHETEEIRKRTGTRQAGNKSTQRRMVWCQGCGTESKEYL